VVPPSKSERRDGWGGGRRRRTDADGRRWTPIGFRKLTDHVEPRRQLDSGRAQLARRSLISISKEKRSERSRAKKRDGWRHCERLPRCVRVPKCILMLGKISSVLLSFVNPLLSSLPVSRDGSREMTRRKLRHSGTMLARVICCAPSGRETR